MESRTILPIALSTIIWLATQAATVVVALLVVLPRRALAAWLMLASAGMSLLGMGVGWILPMFLARYFGMEQYVVLNGWVRVALSVWGAAGWGLFLYGLVELCRSIPVTRIGPGTGITPGGPA